MSPRGELHAAEEASEPTPGERLLFALGRLYRLHHRGLLLVRPADVDVGEVAGCVGVLDQVEFSVGHSDSEHWHLPGEVLVVQRAVAFPWRLLSTMQWAAEREADHEAFLRWRWEA